MWSLLAPEGGSGGTSGSLWEHLRHMGVTLASLWGQFGVSSAPVFVSVGDFGSLDGHFTIIVESLWVCKGPFSKNTHFPPHILMIL